MTAKTLRNYLETPEGQQDVEPQILAKLVLHAGNITTLNGLLRWARERFSDHYHADLRKPTGMPGGRTAMAALWARYLDWSEEA